MTSRKLLGFLDPLLSVLFVTLWVIPPPERDIIYGWPLTGTHAS